MKVTIIHKDGCPRCDVAIKEFTEDGHEVELFTAIQDIPDKLRRDGMMADLMTHDGDHDARPCVFIYDRFIPWEPRKTGA